MNEFLTYYQKELSYLKHHGKLFASRFPKIARRLGIVEGETEDPHVSRLIESFALLTSRIHQRLDEDMPDVIDALLSTLAPQFMRPLPSVCIVMMTPDPLKSGLTGKNSLAAETSLFTRHSNQQSCHFQTSYPVTLLPLSVSEAELYFDSDALSWQLQLHFQVWPGASLADETLRLYLHGPSNAVSTLYTLLCSEVKHLSLHHGEDCLSLTPKAISPVGFAASDALLTREPRIAPVHILLLDYFWFPQKFSFIDIQLPAGFRAVANDSFELRAQFQCNSLTERLEKLVPLVDKHFFRLHCAPAVNLFTQRADPIVLNDAVAEYPLMPNSRHQGHTEVWAVQQVSLQRKVGNQIVHLNVLPLLDGGGRLQQESDSGLRWQSIQRDITGTQGTEHQSYLAFSQRTAQSAMTSSDIVTADLLCSNGERAYQLQYGLPEGDFDADAPLAGLNIVALTHPTRPVPPPDKCTARWRFLSQLSLNHQLLQGKQGAQRLIETLALYHFDDDPGKSRLFTQIQDLRCEPVTARLISNDPYSLARGISLTLTFSHSAQQEPEYYLLCSLLDRLLALYAPVNSFTRLTTEIEHDSRTRRVWPVRAGRLSWL